MSTTGKSRHPTLQSISAFPSSLNQGVYCSCPPPSPSQAPSCRQGGAARASAGSAWASEARAAASARDTARALPVPGH
eukprot:18463-Rhodomonas_salina.2